MLLIAGMRGNGCRERIARALAIVAGVKDVDVNLYRARATISHEPPCGAADLVRAVVRAGYGAALAANGGSPRTSGTADGEH